MQQETIPPVLENKKIADPVTRFTPALEAAVKNETRVVEKLRSVFSSKKTSGKLSGRAAELALLFVRAIPTRHAHSWNTTDTLAYGSQDFNRIRNLLGEKEWNDPANYEVLLFLFGDEKASLVRYAWEQIRYQMYQTGWARRSFRSPENRELYLQRQVEFLKKIIPQSYLGIYNKAHQYEHVYFDLSLTEQIKWANLLKDLNPELFRLWSAAIDNGHQEVFQMLENIVFNKEEDGKITRGIIKALLNSNKIEAWQLVEKLLLAAQRQEGLRQTILEALDETSIGALRFMIRVILDHQLTRFSSVVRAVDTWAGLGWESERESTVKSFLEKASQYLENPGLIPQAVKSENNADVYMALWAQGIYDVEKNIPYLQELYITGNTEKRSLALIFADQTAHYKIRMPMFYAALDDRELAPLTLALNSIESMAQPNADYYDQEYPRMFDKLHSIYKHTAVREKTFESLVFSWQKFKFEKKNILRIMIWFIRDREDRMKILLEHFPEMDAEIKAVFTNKMLPGYGHYYGGPDQKKIPSTLTPLQRHYALLALADRSEFRIAFKALAGVQLSKKEVLNFPDLLKRKAAEFRNSLIQLLLRQSDQLIEPVIEQALTQGDPEQRLAALDILLQLDKTKRLANRSSQWIAAFRERKNITVKEEILLSQLTEQYKPDLSEENGFGLIDTAQLKPVIEPFIDASSLYEQAFARHAYGFSMPLIQIKKACADLLEILDHHREHEYEVHHWDNSIQTVLLGNTFRVFKYHVKYETPRQHYESYPLPGVWEAWYTKWKLQPQDLLIIGLGDRQYTDDLRQATTQQVPYATEIFPESIQQSHYHQLALLEIINALRLVFPFKQINEFCIGATNRLFDSLSQDVLLSTTKKDYYNARDNGWQNDRSLNCFMHSIDIAGLEEKHIEACWNLYHWRQFNGRPESFKQSYPPLLLFCRAFEAGIIAEADLYRSILTNDTFDKLTNNQRHKGGFNYVEKFPFLQPMFDRARDIILDIELKRGDSPTAATALASSLYVLYGIDRFVAILAGLGKTTLHKGYFYSWSGEKNKQESFSALLKRCQPLPDDTQDDFNRKIKLTGVKNTRLIEAAVYAPQWQKFISGFLGWEGLDSAIWWMHAHTKTDGYTAQNAEAESEIAKYSTIDIDEFKDGAVDKEWFIQAHTTIDKDKWDMVYDAARYVSDGNGHRRARIYADVLEGNLGLKEVTEKIITKRDQDYVRIYGLAPLDQKNMEKDILARYEFLQQFKKESRQFGSLKQSSEGKALQVAMDNLARNAGYPDPVRLTWAMETKQVQEIFSKQTQVQYDDILIRLVIDKEGNAEVEAVKDNKLLKAIPAKYKKDKKVEELTGFRKTLREQFKRARKGLEDAMVRGDLFLPEELTALFEHPVISKHLEKLVLAIDRKETPATDTGFYRAGVLTDPDNNVTTITGTDRLRIAHCTDLRASGKWAGYQRQAFDDKLSQPFKQIFRELYLPTEDELKEKSVSRRYAGHQVQPKQTVALLKSRGWKVDYEEGLQKLFPKEGYIVKMYAVADWFSPADIENPTLETVEFHNRKDFKNIEFSSINPRLFSEVMRDIDLVVSVAHAGGVDAEASHSSIEMRTVLLKETLRLFKINNVEISGSHAKIKGTMGEYSVHLGSGVAHKVAAGYLSIIPVHSQQRGRLFLPFADDDPKTAEVISKVLLLARDKEIQDPTVLRQLS